MKKSLIIANWKMNLDIHQASILVKRLGDSIPVHRDMEIILAPSMLDLYAINHEIDHRKFKLAAQNAYFVDEGAYTGEVSFTMIKGIVDYVIVGHSERRAHFNEDLPTVKKKVEAAIRNGIKPILCIGETKDERHAGEAKRVLHDQLTTALSNLTPEEVGKVVIAYEPVWAIGTGTPEDPDDIAKVIGWIRHNLKQIYDEEISTEQTIIYGASVEPEFTSRIMSIKGIDGLLVGHASLNYKLFAEIVANTHATKHSYL
jgi:triosephosphate isomerase